MAKSDPTERLKKLENRIELLEELAASSINAKLNHIITLANSQLSQGGLIMADLTGLTAQVDALAAKIAETAVTLAEIKAALDAIVPSDPAEQAAIDAITARLTTLIGELGAAETAADITPDTP